MIKVQWRFFELEHARMVIGNPIFVGAHPHNTRVVVIQTNR